MTNSIYVYTILREGKFYKKKNYSKKIICSRTKQLQQSGSTYARQPLEYYCIVTSHNKTLFEAI